MSLVLSRGLSQWQTKPPKHLIPDHLHTPDFFIFHFCFYYSCYWIFSRVTILLLHIARRFCAPLLSLISTRLKLFLNMVSQLVPWSRHVALLNFHWCSHFTAVLACWPRDYSVILTDSNFTSAPPCYVGCCALESQPSSQSNSDSPNLLMLGMSHLTAAPQSRCYTNIPILQMK